MYEATYTLRRSSIDDAALFYNVIDRTMREFIIKTWDRWDESRVRRESEEKSRDPNAQIVRVADISVGVFVVERHPTHIQLAQIYLLPEYQRRGIGTNLLKTLIAEASHSKKPVRLHVMAVNPAKSFYERLGFSVTEATPEFFYMEKLP
jgi:ribosomal protein S18 acetylase RimI-like enzyme